MKTPSDQIYHYPGVGLVADLPERGGVFEIHALEYVIVNEKKMGIDTSYLERLLLAMRQTTIMGAAPIEQLEFKNNAVQETLK